MSAQRGNRSRTAVKIGQRVIGNAGTIGDIEFSLVEAAREHCSRNDAGNWDGRAK